MLIYYKCSGCGASMRYDIKLGKLKCSYCDHTEDITPDGPDIDTDPVETYICSNCGGVIELPGKETASICPYCDSAVVVSDRLAGDMHPSLVLPFAMDRKEAEEAFKKWCHNGRFSPAGFTSAENLKKIRPIYVPYWLYDADTTTTMKARATKTHTYRSGDYEVTETYFYDVGRTMRLHYDQVPYDASEEMDDDLMAKIAPYDYSALKVFQMPYLAGFDASQRDYSDQELLPLVKHAIDGYCEDQVRATITGYGTVNVTYKDVDYRNIKTDYAYMPVWYIHYPFNDKDYFFAMNGQTGKIAGTPPISKAKVAAWFGGMSGILFVILSVIGGLVLC